MPFGEAFHGVIWRGGSPGEGSMCIYTHTYKCVCSPSPEKDARYPALSLSTLIPETGSLAEPRVRVLVIFCLASSTGGSRVNASMLVFFMEAGNLNSSLHACEKVLLPTESYPQDL